MSLVQYSDSESESDTEVAIPPLKKPRHGDVRPSALPPLPSSFHDLYASSTRVSVKDDPSLHGGRKRVIPHVEGNWPTHIYLEWYPSKRELSYLAPLITHQSHGKEAHQSASSPRTLLQSDLGAQLPLHISLSRPVVLRTEQRSAFAESLSRTLQNSLIAPFDVTPGTLKWVSNYEKTRWFLVLQIERPGKDELNRLLHLCNNTLAQFDQPPLYAKPLPTRPSQSPTGRKRDSRTTDHSDCFHISLAWRLSEPSRKECEHLETADLKSLEGLHIRFDSIKAKIGNHVESIPLK